MVEAHCGILLPFSHHFAAIVEALPYAGPIQVLERPNQRQIRYDFEPVFLSKSILTQMMLAGTNIKAVTAVKNLIYSGTCCLDKVGFRHLIHPYLGKFSQKKRIFLGDLPLSIAGYSP